jgi:DNA processing protein
MKISDLHNQFLRNCNIKRKGKYYYRGNWDEKIFKNSIAIVGSRQMTRYGREVVDKFVSDFVANGITTISGFMYGVDTEVAAKTVGYGGVTVAVFGCGLDHIYPPENEKLYLQILEAGGLVISEYEPSAKPHLWKFPQRNKIVAGLASTGVLVVEAGESSGSLLTARIAKDMGKNVYAVPGPINSKVSEGCNKLIKSGQAVMVTSAADIIHLKIRNLKSEIRNNIELPKEEAQIYKLLQCEPLEIDEIVAKTEDSIIEIGSTLSMMGIKGLVTESGGKYYLSK